MRVFCYASHACEALNDWLLTARRCGYEPEVIGLGEAWHGFRQKMQGWRGAAERVAQEQPEEVILFTDSYDVLFNAPCADAMDAFQHYGKPILIGMESLCGVNCAGPQPIPDGKSRFKFINSGVIMGKSKELAQFMREAESVGIDDDQVAVGTVCQRDGGHRVGFDTEQRLVGNLVPWRDLFRLSRSGSQVKVGNATPCVLHFYGTGSDLMQRESYIRVALIGSHRRPSWSDLINRTGRKIKASGPETMQLLGSKMVKSPAVPIVLLIVALAFYLAIVLY